MAETARAERARRRAPCLRILKRTGRKLRATPRMLTCVARLMAGPADSVTERQHAERGVGASANRKRRSAQRVADRQAQSQYHRTGSRLSQRRTKGGRP